MSRQGVAELLSLVVSCFVLTTVVHCAAINETPKTTTTLSMLMPDVQPKQDDTYLCLAVPLDTTKTTYIVGFKPKASMEVAHHILLYGCEEPGSTGKPWNCGEMRSSKETKKRSICKKGETIMYAWAMDAPDLTLPKDVGFKVGGNTGIHSLVLQIHYKDVSSFLPPSQVVSGYRVRNGQWKEIGRVSPQLPQMFYPVSSPGITVNKGDILAARCTMVNNGKKPINIGSTSKDEMCNFYMMYYVEGDKIVEDRACFSPGPPTWNWKTFEGLHPENAPKTASIIPDSDPNIRPMHDMMEKFSSNQDQGLFEDRPITNEYAPDHLEPTDELDSGRFRDVYDLRPLAASEFGPDLVEAELDPNVMPEFDPISLPQFEELGMPEFEPLDSGSKPSSGETVSIINDKENGGKGYRKTKDVFKQLNVPNGLGYYKESRQETGYTWNSEDAKKPDGHKKNADSRN